MCGVKCCTDVPVEGEQLPNGYTINYSTDLNPPSDLDLKQRSKEIHTLVVLQHTKSQEPNKILGEIAPPIYESETTLPRNTRCTLAQLRNGKSPILYTYLNKINPLKYPSPLCPLCSTQPHDTKHLFQCPKIPTQLTPLDLWTHPTETSQLLTSWMENLPQPQ